MEIKTIYFDRNPRPPKKARPLVKGIGPCKTFLFQGGQSLEAKTTEKATIFEMQSNGKFFDLRVASFELRIASCQSVRNLLVHRLATDNS